MKLHLRQHKILPATAAHSMQADVDDRPIYNQTDRQREGGTERDDIRALCLYKNNTAII